MKKILWILSLLFAFNVGAQITSTGHNSVLQTAYTNGRPNDNIYVYCGTQMGQANGQLTATPASGTGPFSFVWSYYNETNNSWVTHSQELGATSTLTNLPSDGYQVMIRDANNVLVGCYVAWVWNLNIQVSPTNNPLTCNSTTLNTGASAENVFNYYNIPPGQSIITANTQITVCFSAVHTYVSDLGFFLRAPNGATISLSPNPGAIGQGSVCNSGDNVNNLCFSTSSTANLNICTASTPLSGTYGSYGSPATPINWSPLIGQNAAQGGWAVQIYDCIGADYGSLTNASITFTNLDISNSCEAEQNITYSSGSINSAINDNSCNAATASIFMVPLPINLTTPITLTAQVTGVWQSSQDIPAWNGNTSSMNGGPVVEIPSGTTNFVYTVTASINGATCVNSGSTTFVNECCTAVSDVTPTSITMCPDSPETIAATATGDFIVWRPSIGLSDSTATSPTISLQNNSHNMLETYYYLHVFDYESECERIDSVLVRVHGKPFIQLDSTICEPVVQVTGTIATNPGSWLVTAPNYSQTYTTLNPNIIFPTPGIYTVAYTDGCGNSISQLVRRVQPPALPLDTVVCETAFSFPASDLNGVTGLWTATPGSVTVNQSTVTLYGSNEETTNYVVRLTEEVCGFYDERVIKIVGLPKLTAPEYSCMPVEFDIFATSYEGGTWDLLSTNPTTINLDSFQFLYNVTSDNIAIKVGEHGTYRLHYTDAKCGHEATIDVTFKPYVWTEVKDTSICLGATMTLQSWIPPYPVEYMWSTGSTEPAIVIDGPGIYSVKVSNECYEYSDTAVVTIKMCDIEAPNVISLGSQVGNNIWYVQHVGIMDFECVIVDRWGNVVAEFDQVTGYWDGTDKGKKRVSEGVYFYKIIAKTEGQEDVFKQGFITVVH